MPKASFSNIFLLIIFFFFTSVSNAQDDKTMAETVVHLLSYVSMDYSGAVEDGEIIDQMEYEEQQEFSEEAYQLTYESNFVSGSDKEELLQQIQALRDSVDQKSPSDEISRLANRINSRIIRLTGLVTTPKVWPDLANGQLLYQQTCALCHGNNGKGDGPGGVGLDPEPSDFHEIELMENFSPYQAYNSIRLGVPGTGMQAYAELHENEIWDLAFYVKSLRFETAAKGDSESTKTMEEALEFFDLAGVANLTDEKLRDSLALHFDHPEKYLIALRTQMPESEGLLNSLPIAREGLQEALESYQSGNRKLARTQAISAYLEGIEPVEARLKTIDAKFVVELETKMFNVRNAIEKDMGSETVEAEVRQAMEIIDEADKLLKGQKLNYWLTFIIAGSIFLREAIEAFLILAVVIALIRSTGARKALPWLHGGWISAVLLGVAGWFLSDYIIQFGGKNREVMEGLVSLLAVAVLVYMGFWLHSKTEAAQWTKFIKEKIDNYLQADKMFGLAIFSFFIVFREAFEVILFLQAVNLEAAPENKSAIGLGVLVALVIVGIIAYFFFKFSKMFPVRKIFLYSSWIILLLALILMGRGIHSLQESGWVNVTYLPGMFRLEWLGIYPTLQTLLGQLALIAIYLIIFFVGKNKQKKEALNRA